MGAAPAEAYDALAYPGYPYPQTHPDRLATQATLFGLRPAPPAACRVLELGAGDGANLLPMALALPGSAFVGVDLAGAPVARGRATIAALGAGNLTLAQGDVAALPPEADGEFDYIIAHGLYSWVPPRVRDALMAVCAQRLAPHGVAYVSYNAYPGSYLRDMTRDILRFHVDGVEDPAARVAGARALLETIAAAGQRSPYGAVLRDHVGRLLARSDAALFHDEMADVNTPVYFHEFTEHAGRFGLQFLAEARLRDMQAPELPDTVAAALAGLPDNVIVREQYLDFLVNRTFRQTLLCRGDVAVERTLRATVLDALHVRGRLVNEDGRWRSANDASAQPQDAAFDAALERVAGAWPRAAAFTELTAGLAPAAAGALAESLLEAHAAGLVDLLVEPPAPARRAGERPRAAALARHQAAGGATAVTSLHHDTVTLQGPLAATLVTLLDGTRDRAALLAALDGRPGTPPAGALPAALDRALDELASLALLEA